MLRYENDNTKGDRFFDTKASKLTLMVDYPSKNVTQDGLMWIKT
jgi:hypothetical protein